MNELLTGARLSLLRYRLALAYGVLFCVFALGSCIISALTGVDWQTLDGQRKFMICTSIITNLAVVIMAFLSKESKKIGGPELDEKPTITLQPPTLTK